MGTLIYEEYWEHQAVNKSHKHVDKHRYQGVVWRCIIVTRGLYASGIMP